jgi:tRNA uridine 5-carboxymethylaminomethyl modification enzyme
LKRSEAYIGVLIDDLINKGTDEPYRMFTSRAEYRTLLRQDNADIRLTDLGYRIGLISSKRMNQLNEKKAKVEELKNKVAKMSVEPEQINTYLNSVQSSPLVSKQKLYQIVLRPGIELKEIIKNVPAINIYMGEYETDIIEQAEIQIKYETYIQKEKELVEKMSQLENLIIPENFNYNKLVSLSNEARQKFIKIQPRTLGQASRISGVNPSDVQMLMVYMGR